jgi:hemerythrin superfamily protein
MADQHRDVIEILMHDHREVEHLFSQLESLRGANGDAERARRKQLVDKVTLELVRHSVAEEAEVYPAVKDKLGEAEAERAKREHAEAEETMKRLEALQPDNPAFDNELGTLMLEVRSHVAEEEGEIFPQMREAFSSEELAELGAKVEAVKRLAPTRPHPSAPDGPPGDKVVGPIVGLFDRMRDAVARRGGQH